ncbi:MAG: DNA-binding protein [Alcanivoracaceae bacterium]|nr:DNA-binding protein [Alcanivoracaceae bacterium]
MANLVVRNIDEDIVKALKARADLLGHSAEAEHRIILANTLLRPRKKSFAEILKNMPNVGMDDDFKRRQQVE